MIFMWNIVYFIGGLAFIANAFVYREKFSFRGHVDVGGNLQKSLPKSDKYALIHRNSINNNAWLWRRSSIFATNPKKPTLAGELEFEAAQIKVASPDTIKKWTQRQLPNGKIVGEIRTLQIFEGESKRIAKEGLFCEMIFGPKKSWRCACGKYRQINKKVLGLVCPNCEVEITSSRVRKYRMGYIKLPAPIAHTWYVRSPTPYITLLLESVETKLSGHAKLITPSQINDLIYYNEKSSNNKTLEIEKAFKNKPFQMFYHGKQVQNMIRNFRTIYEERFGYAPREEILQSLQTRRGGEIVLKALEEIDDDLIGFIEQDRTLLLHYARNKLRNTQSANSPIVQRLCERIRLLESLLFTKMKASWLMLTNLPVLPPTLRPFFELSNDAIVNADVNELYRDILSTSLIDTIPLRVENYQTVLTMGGQITPSTVLRMLQEQVDILLDRPPTSKLNEGKTNRRPLKSLTEIIEAKEGRFRLNVLGTRVDYSGRSVIVAGPALDLNQCGLPYVIAYDLFKPYLKEILKKILINEKLPPKKLDLVIKEIFNQKKPILFKLIRLLTYENIVLLNRAPSLHKYAIQAFEPVIVMHKAIELHPLVCGSFNADFDGDQMAVHLPLSDMAKLEAYELMRPQQNILSVQNGKPLIKPTQDMIIGLFYLTFSPLKFLSTNKKIYTSHSEVLSQLYQKVLSVHTPIIIKYNLNQLKYLFSINEKSTELNFIHIPFTSLTKKILIEKIFWNNEKNLCYFITKLGVLVGRKILENYENNNKNENKIFENYELIEAYLETTPGQIVLKQTLNNILLDNSNQKEIKENVMLFEK